MMQATSSISDIQQELLKLYSANIADVDLLNIKQYLAKYFAANAIAEADRIWEEKNYSNETMSEWLNENDKPHDERVHYPAQFLIRSSIAPQPAAGSLPSWQNRNG